MKKYPLLTASLFLAIASALVSCNRETAAPADNTPDVRPLSAREAQTIATTNDFAFRLFKKVNEGAEGENIFVSPFSVATALTMAYNGAATTTKDQIRNTLGLGSLTDAEINSSYQSLYELLRGIDRTVTFTSANSVWYRNPLQPQPDFVQTNRTYLNAEMKGLDFDSPSAKNTINSWVNTQTNGRIPEVINALRPEHVMLLINAVYFKGTWVYKFDKAKTAPGNFNTGSGVVQHPFMELSGAKYLLHRGNSHTLVDLPYGNKQFSMTLILPDPSGTADDLLSTLSAAKVGEWLAAADSSSLQLYLPKFKLECEKNLNQTLKDLGMPEAFGGGADFSGMITSFRKGDLSISEVKHKSFVEVDEEGAEAAAVTSIAVMTRVSELPPSIRFDRPFVFLIREKASGAILFMGKLAQPQ